MAKKPMKKFLEIVLWLTMVIISLAVEFGLVSGVLALTIIGIPLIVTQVAGWIAIVLTALVIIGKIAKWF